METIKREVGVGIITTGEDVGREETVGGEKVWRKEEDKNVEVLAVDDVEEDDVEEEKREFLAWGDELLVLV